MQAVTSFIVQVLLSFGPTPQAHVQDEKENSRPMRVRD